MWIEIAAVLVWHSKPGVTPRAGVWIEITTFSDVAFPFLVTPRAGVWIEILLASTYSATIQRSLPVRECGLKSKTK